MEQSSQEKTLNDRGEKEFIDNKLEDSLVRRITSAHIRAEIDEESKDYREENSKVSITRRNTEDDAGNIEEICKNIVINKDAVKLLKFIAVCERETVIFNVILKYLNKEDVTDIEKLNFNSQEGIDKVIDIASDAIFYTISIGAFESLDYILKF